MENSKEMRYLGWKQPYANLMLHGKAETRTWPTKYRGLVLITASKIPYSDNKIIEISGIRQFNRIRLNLKGSHLRYGYAIAVGRLVDCRPMQVEDEYKCFVQYQKGLYMHVYEDVKPIVPIQIKGAQGWRKLSKEFIDKIEYL